MATFQIKIKLLKCEIVLQNFTREVTSIITFDCHDNYLEIRQNSLCTTGSTKNQQLHIKLERLLLQQVLSDESFAGRLIDKKNKQHFHHHTAYNYRGECKSHMCAKKCASKRITYIACLHCLLIVKCGRLKCMRNPKWLVRNGLHYLWTGDRDF